MRMRRPNRTFRIATMISMTLVAAFPPGARPSDDSVELVFRPEAGATLTNQLEMTTTLELVESSFVEFWEGREVPHETDETRVIDQSERYTFVDEVVAVDGDRVTQLIRSFEEIHSEHDSEGRSGEQDWSDAHSGTSELESMKVSFEWDDEEEQYGCKLEDDEEEESDIDEEFLAGLELDIYMIGMLPEEEVSIGDSWEVGADTYFRIVYPSGVLRIVSHEGDDPSLDSGYELRDSIEGQVTLTLVEVEDSDEGRVAVIRVEIETENGSSTESDVEWESVGSGTSTDELTISTELSGEARWSLDRNLPISLELSGTHRYEKVVAASISGEREYENSYITVLSGDIEFELTCE